MVQWIHKGSQLVTDAEKLRLSGVATGATKNATDAQLRGRGTHTGTQDVSTVTGAAIETSVASRLGTKIDKTSIVGESGQATDKVMSQKAVTDLVGDIDAVLDAINGEVP